MAATERHLRRRRHRDDPHRPEASRPSATGAVVSFTDVEKRFDSKQPWVAHVHVATNGKQTLRDREITITQCALD